MKVLGIVGGIGAGKTTVVTTIAQLHPTYVIGADEIGHQLLLKEGKAYEQVIEAFGPQILDEDGQIVRARLGAIVFGDEDKLSQLNQITHPLIYSEVASQLQWCKTQAKWDFIIVDAALLIEIGLIQLVDSVIGVYASEEIRIERIMKRGGGTLEEAQKRIASQKPWEMFQKVSHFVIDNSFSYQTTKEKIQEILSNW